MAFRKKIDIANPSIQMGLKVRLYPTEEQKILINKTIGSARFVYNSILAAKKEAYDHGVICDISEKTLKEENLWLKEVDSTALQQARINLAASYDNFFKSLKGQRSGAKMGFPKFKSKHSSAQTYRSVMGMECDLQNRSLKLLKVGKIKFSHKNYPEWTKRVLKLNNVTISRSKDGRYHAALNYDVRAKKVQEHVISSKSKMIGLDMALGKLFIDSNGSVAPGFQKNFKTNQRKISRLSRKLNKSRKPSGSTGKNRDKKRMKLARAHGRVARIRKDYLHKLSRDLVNNYDVIGIEDLNLAAMSKFNFGKSIMENGWGMFTQMLDYKSKQEGKILVKADRWFPSSKLCSCCGNKKEDLTLKDRSWTCDSCGSAHDRDVNAANNILNYTKNHVGWEAPELTPVEIAVRLSMKQEKDLVTSDEKVNGL